MSETAATPVLELRELRRSFGGVKAVDGITLSVLAGDVVALIGPNGAGKSTLFALMMGELAASAGEIHLDGRDMRRLSARAHARAGIGRTFQAPRLFAGLSVWENILAALGARTNRSDREGPPPADALGEVGLYERRAELAGSLSQGQRKRLELAMVLALRPRLLLLDEPTAGMGVAERAAVMELVMAAVQWRRLTMVFCEHDMETVFAHADRVVVMDRGAIVADGTPREVREDPHVQSVYLGGGFSHGGAPR
ncbi:MAG TPA: ATP-binding cassette domain-containing protein [Solirubrobacteraceae bacterium]|nr:ATP-binding cassette domain-containing protein [Solirubrobacteraceae bacterium]